MVLCDIRLYTSSQSRARDWLQMRRTRKTALSVLLAMTLPIKAKKETNNTTIYNLFLFWQRFCNSVKRTKKYLENSNWSVTSVCQLKPYFWISQIFKYRISSYKTLPQIIPAFLIMPTPGTLLCRWNLVISNNSRSWRPHEKIIPAGLIWVNMVCNGDTKIDGYL